MSHDSTAISDVFHAEHSLFVLNFVVGTWVDNCFLRHYSYKHCQVDLPNHRSWQEWMGKYENDGGFVLNCHEGKKQQCFHLQGNEVVGDLLAYT